ncbi:nicotinate phosphoribosyltransferase [Natranaerovirga hydrolytica]|uniref:Nicotinate phosphoribosyltransferase n=1 Tax=Natranaerovirga hydrolytica TaxID=680378 RepID=A0A4R1MPU4_9FIRM|nr:nicotinate phosphoribosyltransferase [Natranaerovirga hydrolytica]TCK93354.1 nicotinate phosphoribosyltransferase [Natranaerovirga hydrolytica]
MNLTLLTDFYELTMMQGYYKEYDTKQVVVFDFFYRSNPCGGAYSIFAGLEQVIDYINDFNFTAEDIQYLREQKIFEEDFLEFLSDFKFTGDIYSVPEGTVIFPNEPVMKIIAPIMEAQIIETAILNIVNHQSLIATKASRVKWAAEDDMVLEFGLRRAQGPDAGVYGARAAVIGGCSATSNVLAGKKFDIPVKGTHAHSWVMSFNDELTAFRKYANLYPDACILLVDTYDTLKTGVPNAIKVFNELKEKGIQPKLYGIRLDSGDLAYLSKKARKMLDEVGFEDAIISASSDLDEYLIQDLKSQGAKITLWGVGTNLITSKDCPAFGGVYKLTAVSNGNEFVPKIKVSENPAKITNPGNKKIYRVYDKATGIIKADLIALEEENIKETEPLLLFDPNATWKRTILEPNTFVLKELLVPIFKNGSCVYATPNIMEIQSYCQKELKTLWPETKRTKNPQEVFIDLTMNLYNLKQSMIERYKSEV